MFPNWQYIKIDKNRHSKSTHFKVRTSLYMSLLIAQLAAPMVDLNKKINCDGEDSGDLHLEIHGRTFGNA
jgi:hypothetical protein